MFNKILAVTAAVVNSSELHPGTDPAAINGPMSVLLQNVLYKGSLSLPRTCRKKENSYTNVHHKEGIPKAVTASIVPETRLELRVAP